MKFLTAEYSLDLLLKILSLAIPCMAFVLKYASFCLNSETVSQQHSRTFINIKRYKIFTIHLLLTV